ncbi:MAG TPA: transposase [Geobacteraceae bacterium]|nr:transposase [Geobacteraceae bacterium]
MPRIARALVDNCCYHLINRGNGRLQIYHKEGDYRAFIDLLLQARGKYGVRLRAWCLMPNHFHLVVQPTEAGLLNKWVQWLMTTHVRRYHKHYGSSGHVWQGRYKSFIVQDDEHLLTVTRYIEGNPVRALLAPTVGQWPWSSYQGRIAATDELRPDPLPIALPEDWAAFVGTPLTDAEIEKVRNSVNRQTPLGHESWLEEMCMKLGLESTVRRRGWQKGRKRKE